MKNLINKYLLLFVFAGIGMVFTSCDDFLDKQEDEQLTFEKIWQSRNYTKQYWLNSMSFIPKEMGTFIGDADPYLGASDECTITYDRSYRSINFGSWNPSNVPNSIFGNMYKGIRECNIFMQNVDNCSDPVVTPKELAEWKVQSRFARAYYYFNLMRLWGPVFIIGDEIIDAFATTEELYRPRNTWEECVNYVVSELNACIADPAMYDTWASDGDKGLATKGTCKALISRLTLYSARPLFNGNTMYSGVKNPTTDLYPELSGVNLFPTTYDPKKWLVAANAAKELIDDSQYELYRAASNNPYDNYYGITNVVWNKEIIWSTGYIGRYNVGVNTVPTGVAGTAYGGVGPTQQQVDAYAMSNGKYPIKGYTRSGDPLIDETSGYPETEMDKSKWTYPAWGGGAAYTVESPEMYKNREPRFYVNVFFSGQKWQHASNQTLISFAKGANGNRSHDYPKSGYTVNRFYDHTQNSANGSWGNLTFPTFRLGEMYLNFIEAVLECKRNGVALPSGYETLAMQKWDELRNRSGVKPISDVYPGASVDDLVELCRKERRVELSFESHRFFDTRTWMISTQVDRGDMYGMNVMAPSSGDVTPDEFWKRSVFETRVFKNNHYLYPFEQRELDRNKLLTQNYGW